MAELSIKSPAGLNEDDAHVDGEKGLLLLGVRKDTVGSLADTDGDRVPFQFDDSGNLRIVSGSSDGDKSDIIKVGGVAVSVKDDAFLEPPLGVGIEFETLGVLTVDGSAEGDKVPLKGTAQGVLYTQLTDGVNTPGILSRSTGTEQPVKADDALVVYDVGGGSASVSSEYRATTNGNGDATVVYTSGTTLTVTGAPFTLQNEDLVYVREVDSTANTAAIFVNGAGGVHLEISSGVVTKSGGTDFSANGVYELGFNGQDKAYSSAGNEIRTKETNDLSTHHLPSTLATVTNETSGTNYYYFDMDGFRTFSVDVDTSGTTPVDTLTITIEAGNQDDGTAQASIFYQDTTNAWFGVASVVDADLRWERDTPLATKFVRIKTVTAGGNNDADYTIFLKQMF